MVLDITAFTNPYTYQWAGGLFAVFTVLLLVFSMGGPCKGKPGQAAHHLTMFLPFIYLCTLGLKHWFTSSAEVKDDSAERLFGDMAASAPFAPTMLGMQIFDLTTTALIPAMCKPDAVGHHAVALVLAYQLTSTGFLQYWQPFYFGMLELSSVPLVFVDFFRAFPALAKRFDAVNELCRVLFAATFIPIRCLYMPYVSYVWWKDFISLYMAGHAKLMDNLVLFVCFGSFNIFLVGIQQYWGAKIIAALRKMLAGDKSGREKEG